MTHCIQKPWKIKFVNLFKKIQKYIITENISNYIRNRTISLTKGGRYYRVFNYIFCRLDSLNFAFVCNPRYADTFR